MQYMPGAFLCRNVNRKILNRLTSTATYTVSDPIKNMALDVVDRQTVVE